MVFDGLRYFQKTKIAGKCPVLSQRVAGPIATHARACFHLSRNLVIAWLNSIFKYGFSPKMNMTEEQGDLLSNLCNVSQWSHVRIFCVNSTPCDKSSSVQHKGNGASNWLGGPLQRASQGNGTSSFGEPFGLLSNPKG